MRRLTLILFCCIGASPCQSAETIAGRWEGAVQIPGDELALIVDLAQDNAKVWTGSLIAPALNIKGAVLTDIVATGDEATFTVRNALGTAQTGQAKFKAHLDAHGAMTGEFLQGGNSAAFALHRTGPAQVEMPARSTAVAKAIEGKWVGEYEFGGYPRHVTLDLINHAHAPATAEFVVVGKKTTNVPIDLITQDENFLHIESSATGINFEGPFDAAAGDIRGTFTQGPFELPLILHRAGGAHK